MHKTCGQKMSRGLMLSGALAMSLLCVPAGVRGDSPSLDELLDLKPAPARPEQPEDGSGEKAKTPDPLAEPDRVIAPPEAGGSPEQLLDRALERMRQASDRMGENQDVGLQTQRLQVSALSLMDQVIAEAAKRQQQKQQEQSSQEQSQQQKQQNGSEKNASQSQPKPGQPGGSSQSGEQPGQSGQPGQQSKGGDPSRDGTTPGSPADAKAGQPLEEMKNQWGNLPPRLRDQLLQGMNERFSPIYQQLTEAYYRKLAEASTE